MEHVRPDHTLSQEHRIEAIGDESGLPPIPDVSLRRSEPALCAQKRTLPLGDGSQFLGSASGNFHLPFQNFGTRTIEPHHFPPLLIAAR